MVLPTWTMRLASHAHDLDENAHDTKGGWHQPVRVATTADITIATALNNGDTIDGVTLATGDRVLVKDQTADEQNGIYIAGATPARSEDGDASEEILGSLVYVIAGTANGGKVFRNTNTSAIVVDTDTISFDELAVGSSIAALDDIPDVNAPSPSDGDVLTWDSTPGEWIAAAPGASGSLTVEEDGGTPTVTNVDHIVFAASGDASVDVVDDGGGQVTVTVDATAGGGSFDTLTRIQSVVSQGSATNPTLTIAAAASGQLLFVVANLTNRASSSVTCTNVTWTQLVTTLTTGTQRAELWVGLVSGGSSGTTITVNTGSNDFYALGMIEVDDPGVTPAAGSTISRATFSSGTDVEAVDGWTSGRFYAAGLYPQNSSQTGYAFSNSGGLANAGPNGVGLIVGYVPVGGSFDVLGVGYAGGGTGGFVASEVT